MRAKEARNNNLRNCGAGFILLAGFNRPLAIEQPIPKSADKSARSLKAAPQLHRLLLRAS